MCKYVISCSGCYQSSNPLTLFLKYVNSISYFKKTDYVLVFYWFEADLPNSSESLCKTTLASKLRRCLFVNIVDTQQVILKSDCPVYHIIGGRIKIVREENKLN